MFDEFLERINSRFRSKIRRQMFLLVRIQMDTNMASLYRKALKQKNHFPKYLAYEKLHWPESWRASLHFYILSYPRFWTIQQSGLLNGFIYFFDGVTVKNSNLIFDRQSTIYLPWIIKNQLNFLVDLVFFHFLGINPHSHTNNLSLNTVAKLVRKQ